MKFTTLTLLSSVSSQFLGETISKEQLTKLRDMQSPIIKEAIMNVTRKQHKDIMSMSQNLAELGDIIELHQGFPAEDGNDVTKISMNEQNLNDKIVMQMNKVFEKDGIDGVTSLYQMKDRDEAFVSLFHFNFRKLKFEHHGTHGHRDHPYLTYQQKLEKDLDLLKCDDLKFPEIYIYKEDIFTKETASEEIWKGFQAAQRTHEDQVVEKLTKMHQILVKNGINGLKSLYSFKEMDEALVSLTHFCGWDYCPHGWNHAWANHHRRKALAIRKDHYSKLLCGFQAAKVKNEDIVKKDQAKISDSKKNNQIAADNTINKMKIYNEKSSQQIIEKINEQKILADQNFLSNLENLQSLSSVKTKESSYQYVLTNLATFVCFVAIFFVASLMSDNNVKDYKKQMQNEKRLEIQNIKELYEQQIRDVKEKAYREKLEYESKAQKQIGQIKQD